MDGSILVLQNYLEIISAVSLFIHIVMPEIISSFPHIYILFELIIQFYFAAQLLLLRFLIIKASRKQLPRDGRSPH